MVVEWREVVCRVIREERHLKQKAGSQVKREELQHRERTKRARYNRKQRNAHAHAHIKQQRRGGGERRRKHLRGTKNENHP